MIPALQGDGKSVTPTKPVAPKPGGEGRTQTSCRGQSQGGEGRGGEGGLPQVLTPVFTLLRVAGQDTFIPTCLLPEAQPPKMLASLLRSPTGGARRPPDLGPHMRPGSSAPALLT